MAFWESLGANGVLVVVYTVYKLFDRCLHSKCRYTKEHGLDYDLGDPTDAPADMEKIAELLKSRSLHHKSSNNSSSV